MPVGPRGIGDVDEPCDVDGELGDLLKSLGFDPGAPIYRATPAESYKEVFERIMEGLYNNGWPMLEPILLSWRTRDRRHGTQTAQVLVELLQAVHKPFCIAPDGPITTGTDFEDPDWYVRGSLIRHWSDPPSRRFHAYIQTEPGRLAARDWPHGMVIQIVKEPSGAEPSTPLSWGIGVLGQ